MKIIVESGATKTAWTAVSVDGQVSEVLTEGLSPTCLDPEYISDIVRKAVPALNPEGRRFQANGKTGFLARKLLFTIRTGPLIMRVIQVCEDEETVPGPILRSLMR